MLRALRTLGEILGGPRLYDPIAADYVAVLDFDAAGNYQGVSLESFRGEDVPRYLYKKAKGSNPPALTPSLIINRGQIAKSLKNARNAYRKLRPLEPTLPDMDLEDENLWPCIVEDMEGHFQGLKKRERVLLTVRIAGQYMGERDDFRRALLSKFREEGQDSAVVGHCAVCGDIKEVSGDISPFKFYTIDKPGYVVGGFDKSLAFKAFPLCYDCRELIQRGRQHVEENLIFAFAPRIRYLLIPDFIFGTEVVHQEVLEMLTEDREQRAQRLHRLNREEEQRITEDEEDILDVLSAERDVMTMHFLFMTRQQGKEAIELYIQDVYPSRLRALFEAKRAIEHHLRYRRDDGTWSDYNFTYGTIYRFFSKADFNKRNPDLISHFYELVDRTFRGVPVADSYLFPFLTRQIRNDVVDPNRRDQQKAYRYTAQDALATLIFVRLTTQKEVSMFDERPTTLDGFLDTLSILDSDLKIGLFLLGVLTERMLRVQYKERGSAPFWKALKGLKMNSTDFQGLLPRVRNKLQEYDKFGVGEALLFQKVSEHLIRTPTPWKMRVDELNFHFALGMGLFPQVAQFVYSKSEEVQA